MNRRNFLSNSGKKLALAGLIGLVPNYLKEDVSGRIRQQENKSSGTDKMLFRTLGRTGIRLPIVSMGVMNANTPALVRAALEQGIRHFDTAWVYQNGNNEKMVGSVLRETGVKREDVIIATKSLVNPRKGKNAKAELIKQLDESLLRLQMEYVDILYYHDVQNINQINDPYIIEAFTELKEKKKIRYSGISTHVDWPEIVNNASEKKFYDVILISFNFAMHNDRKVFDAIRKAYDAGIGLIAMKTQCQQGWYRNNLPSEQQKFYSESNMNSALLKWVLRNEYITTAVPGFTTFDQLREDIAVAYNLVYTKEEENFLRDRNIRLAIQSVCRQCGTCRSTCPKNVDIPSLIRAHMYMVGYGNQQMARFTMDNIEKGRGIEICGSCNECSAKCKYMVQIHARIDELKKEVLA